MTQVPADYLSTTSSFNYEQPFSSVARTSTVTKVPPAKKITFFKSGDPQFAGVKMAINQRSFKSFNALMDDLSHRVPLPFGVRTITTPRGIHCISELDQLEDGGCYLCSDKKYVKPISIISAGHRPGPPQNGRPSSTLRRAAQEGKLGDYSSPFTHHGPRIPKKITLVKNGEIGFRRSIILNRRNARSFKTLLDEISEILQFPVKKLYTVDGKKIILPSEGIRAGSYCGEDVRQTRNFRMLMFDGPGLMSEVPKEQVMDFDFSEERIDSMQALLHCPSMLVCVGREPFKPVLMENSRKHSVEKLPDLAPRSNGNNVNGNNEMDFGLKARKSVIHPRSASSNRSMRFSLSSEKSYPNGLAASPDNGAPFSNSCSHPKPGDLVHSLVNDDIEKRVHVNKDGSLSVEMKVRFRLLNDETLQWSTQIKKSNLMNQMPCEELDIEEDSGVDPIQKMNPEASSEADESLYPGDIDSYMSKLEESECDEAHCHSCGKKHQDYDIWKNPMHTSQREEPSVRSTWHTRSSCSSTSSRRRVVHKKIASVDSLHTTSSEEYSEHVVQESSSYSETVENRVSYRSVKKCRCRSDLSTGASNGEDQQEYTRTSTSHSKRPSSLGLMSHSSCENNLDTQDAPEDHEASKTSSQNEQENCFEVSSVKCLKDDVEELESSRVGSVMSRSSLQSRESKKNGCEETSSAGRSMSSCSLQKANQEDDTRCLSPANSVHSKSSNCTTPKARSEQDDHSDDNAVVSSFSSESCPKKEAEEVEGEQEENEINEVSSVSAKTKPSQSIRGESSEGERCSTQGTSRSRASGRNSKKSDSDEIILCNASCSSRGSKKSKHSHVHLDAKSEMSVSSLESAPNKKKNSLHADDLRSCSRASNYSKSSCEIKKKSVGDLMSHNSGSFQSNISSTSEAEAIAGFTEEKSSKSTTNGYSESSKGSKKRSHREENSKPSSLCSSVSSPNAKAGEGHSKINSETPSSRQGSMSESVCSKAETGIRNGKPSSVSSRVSSKSEVKDKNLLTQISQESDDQCSQSNISQSSKSRRIKTRNLYVKTSNSSQTSLPDTLSVPSMHCPAPPKGKPKSRKIRTTMLKNSSISSMGTESVLTTGKEAKEIIDSSKATSYGSKSAATEVNDQKNKEVCDVCNTNVEEELEGTGTQEEGRDLMPSTLPNTSPEEVVQEWLSKIPSETLLMKYEMEDDAEEECAEATTEVSRCTNAEEISEDEKAEQKNVEEAENEAKDEVGKETAEDASVNEEIEECMNQEQTCETVSEAAKADQAKCSQSVTSSQNNNRRDLPTSVQTSVQIMKALLSSKHETKFDRSNSLPEVSPTMGRKLSNSANILITCLAGLQLLDEASEDPSDKSGGLNKPRYTELLNIFQALWFGCTAENSGPILGQEISEKVNPASGFKAPKSIDYDFTPMSSSGVDVSSGSGGSGEESTAGARDCTLAAQKTAGFKSAGQVRNVDTGTELAEDQEKIKEEEQSSRPSTACSKSKGEENVQPSREESLIQEAEGEEKEQCSNRENGQEEGEENENEENSKLTENGEQEEAVNDELTKEDINEKADQRATTDATSVNDADCGTELKGDLEEQLEKQSPNDPKPSTNVATSVGTSLVQTNSVDPDPVWVLRLLKKIEKEFMTHYVSAMNEFKVRWNLQNNQQMDEMILELKEEVSKRIQRSIEKELRKIKTRAGKKIPRPPDEPLKRESTLQTEQRRRRLQTMRKKSLFSDKNGTQSRLEDTTDLSFDMEEDTAFSAAFEASISKQTSEEEYCPCDSCVRKKIASKPTRNPVVATNAPVMKAFDLQQILRLKKNDEEVCVSEAAQDVETIASSSVKETAENGNPNEENDEGELQPSETEMEGNEEKEPEVNEEGSSVLNEDGEGREISESQNQDMEDEVKDEEAEEVGEDTQERQEEEEANEEEEEKEEEEIMKAGEEEETKEASEGETEEKNDEEVEEEAEEEAKEEEEEKEEEEIMKAGEEEETKEESEGETEEKDDEEVKEEAEEETKEEEEVKEEEEKEEEEETNEGEEGETKEEEEEVDEKEEDAKEEEEEETKAEEEEEEEEGETKEEEEEVQEEEEEVTKEDEEAKEDEEETKEEEQEIEEKEENPEEEEKEVEEGEEEANKEEEEQEEESQNEEQEAEEKSVAADEADNEAEEAEEPDDEDVEADDEEETSECRGDADGCGTDNNPEGDVAEGSGEAEQDEDDAVEDANPESEQEACSAEEENNGEGDEKNDEKNEESISDNPDKAHEKHETLNKAAAFSCYSSVGNFSQESQKGSEDEDDEECKDDNNPTSNHIDGEGQNDDSSKPSQMYPDSEEEDDKGSSFTDPLGDEDQAEAADANADPKEAEHTDEVQASKKKENSDEIDQDDLDF